MTGYGERDDRRPDALGPIGRRGAEESAAVSKLAGVARRVSQSLDITATLDAIVQAVVETLGFGVAVVNLEADDPRLMEVAAVAGPAETRALLMGHRRSRASWQVLIDAAERWGELCFLDHRTAPEEPPDMLVWVPDAVASEDLDAWHPMDSLFAPLNGSDGRLIGVLSVDLPQSGRRPDPEQLRLLELFAAQAAMALGHAAVHTRLADREELFRAVFAQSPVAIALVDADHRYTQVNDAYCRFLDRPRETVLKLAVNDVTHPDDVAMSDAWVVDHLSGDAPPLEKRYRRPDGSTVWGRVRTTRLRTQSGAYRLLTQIEDITEGKRAQARLEHDALHDALTGLPNRALLLDRIAVALSRAGRSGELVAVLFCDLDHFKLVNDAHGHATGDALVLAVAERLRETLRHQDTAGRLGGDEFVAVVDGLDSIADAVTVAERLAAAVHVPVSLGGVEVTPSVSIGIAVAGPQATSEQLLADADAALYRAKAAGRGGWQLFDADMRRLATSELQLREELAAGLSRHELVAHFQPIVDMRSRRAQGYEALLRWNHPARGLLLPGEFLDVILDSELEAPVTYAVVEQACRFAARYGEDRVPYVSVNITPRQLVREDLFTRIVEALRQHSLAPHRLMLELTEDRLLEHQRHTREVARLRRLGVRVAIDDFGTGYASLSALRRLPVDTIKIDRSFIGSLPDDPVSTTIVQAVTDLARLLDRTVIAEGVETEAHAQALMALGVGQAQGWHFGRPGTSPLPAALPLPLPSPGPGQPLRLVSAPGRTA